MIFWGSLAAAPFFFTLRLLLFFYFARLAAAPFYILYNSAFYITLPRPLHSKPHSALRLLLFSIKRPPAKEFARGLKREIEYTFYRGALSHIRKKGADRSSAAKDRNPPRQNRKTIRFKSAFYEARTSLRQLQTVRE